MSGAVSAAFGTGGRRLYAAFAPAFATVYGMLTPFLANMPVFDSNPLGNLIRYFFAAAGLITIAFNFRRVTKNLLGAETLLLGFFVVTILFEVGNAYLTGYVADPYSAVKTIIITVDVYLVAKLLDSKAAVERYMALYCILAVVASIQVIASVFADFFHLRRILMINVSTDPAHPTFLGLGGLLGTIMGGDFRSCFYFSEAGYFGQFLLPAFAYAFQTKRYWSLVVMALAFLGSFSIAALPMAALIILILMLRFGRVGSALIIISGITLSGLLVLDAFNATELAIFAAQDKTGSFQDKYYSLSMAYDIFRNNPLGLGMIDITQFGDRLDPAAGVIMMVLQFGVVQIPLLLMIAGFLFYRGIIVPANDKAAAMALGIGAAMTAALILGPIMKYYTIFMLGALVIYVRIVNGERQNSSVCSSLANSPGSPTAHAH
jgi:hypothetical protein